MSASVLESTAAATATADAAALLRSARQMLGRAASMPDPVHRRDLSCVAAIRAAAAVVALHARAGRPRLGGRPADIWTLLARGNPALAEWADYFSLATRRGGPPSQRAADDLLRDVERFCDRVAVLLPAVPPRRRR